MIRYIEININNCMQYGKVIEEGLRNTSLKRIRVKIDPAIVSKECDFTKCDGYEGYILEENAGSLKVLVLTPDMTIEDIPAEFLEYLASEDEADTFEEFKKFIIQRLVKDGKAENDPLLQNICNSDCINDIEQYVKQCGYTGDNLSELYKDFILDENI